MADSYGSDFITISDEDGKEFELEVLSTLEYNGSVYLAVIPASADPDAAELEVSILKSLEESGGESILCTVDDEQELQAVYDLMMDSLYEDPEEQ